MIVECLKQSRRGGAAIYLVLLVLVALATLVLGLLIQNIATRKSEARQAAFPITQLTETTIDPAEWGKNFPRQYDSYLRTVDVQYTKYGGSEAFQKLDEQPRWRTIFAGYAFAIDYREERGHAYMLSDQRETERVKQKPQPGACLHCHASNFVAYRQVGLEKGAPGTLEDPFPSENSLKQLYAGFEAVCAMSYAEATEKVSHPVSCLDCHDPDSMQLRVTRPGFLTGIKTLAATEEPLPHLPSIERWRKEGKGGDYDPNAMASRQEMRTLVCAQCHVEYYFKGEGKLLTYPWHKGLNAEEIEAYYDEQGFSDWTHAVSSAPALKAQHPEFELWSQGIHARSGVSCADCHMPYKREGAIKVSDHHVRSPLLNINRSCQTCHNFPEDELMARVQSIQDRTRDLMNRAEIAVVDCIGAIEQAMKTGANDAELKSARALQRKAQWRLDFIAAENSMGFHASQEAARILAEAIDFARQGQMAADRAKRGEQVAESSG